MKLELSDLNNGSVFIGDNLNIRARYVFDDPDEIFWSGLRLLTHPPCTRELQIAKAEIFTKGKFEPGEYIREKPILIKPNVVPTIVKRDLGYEVVLLLRKPSPVNPDDDIMVKKTIPVAINIKEETQQAKKPNPISFSISGLSINLTKDVFKPGETIKINYKSQDLTQIEVRLLQTANLVCYCEAYGKNCQKVEELPPAIAGDAKTSNTDEGYLLVKVPEIAEPSHDYLWEPSEKEHWGFKFGDYSKWSLLVMGKPRTGRDTIRFEVPITIVSKPIIEEKEEIDLFSGDQGSPSLFDGVSSKFQKQYKVLSVDSDMEKYSLKIKNIGKDDLKGVTVKTTGLQEGLFETGAVIEGFNTWKSQEEKEIIYETKQNISALITVLTDNSQKSIRLQTPVSSDFF